MLDGAAPGFFVLGHACCGGDGDRIEGRLPVPLPKVIKAMAFAIEKEKDMKKRWREVARVRSAAEKQGVPTETSEAIRGRLALPVPEVAKLLGISSSAVRLMIAQGDFPGRKVGGGTERVTYIVPTVGLLAWLDGTSPSTREEDAA